MRIKKEESISRQESSSLDVVYSANNRNKCLNLASQNTNMFKRERAKPTSVVREGEGDA